MTPLSVMKLDVSIFVCCPKMFYDLFMLSYKIVRMRYDLYKFITFARVYFIGQIGGFQKCEIIAKFNSIYYGSIHSTILCM